MPVYTYTGTVPFIDTAHNMSVQPGETGITTTTFLPSTWTDFTLTDGTGTAIVPHSTEVALSTGVDNACDIENYSIAIFTFKGAPGTDVVEIRTGDATQDAALLLTVDMPKFKISVAGLTDVTLTATTGTPTVIVTKGFADLEG